MDGRVAVAEGMAETLYRRGVDLLCAGDRGAAEQCFAQVLTIDGHHDGAWAATGIIRLLAGDFPGAQVSLSQALQINPGNFPALLNMGIVLQKSGRPDDALPFYEQAVRLNPTSHEALNNLGGLYSDLECHDQAMNCFRLAVALQPDYPAACFNLGNSCKALRMLPAALEWYDRAVALDPGYYEASVNRANVLKDLGQTDAALQGYRAAMATAPDNPMAYSNLLFAMHSSPSCSPEHIFQEHLAWGRKFGTGNRRRNAEPGGTGRLRIGYISPDFRRHSVANFIEPVLAAHDRGSFEVFCYDLLNRPDAVTARLRGYGWQWRVLAGMADDEATAVIRADGIDLLVDLAGHTAGNRILLFDRRAAPVQVTWLGYPNTTGLPAMDYRLTDAVADPPGLTEKLHTEQLVRLPGPFLCYRPAADAPPVAALPAAGQGVVTYISLNNFAKLSAAIITLWARILQQVPHSRLVLKCNEKVDDRVRRAVTEPFGRFGIAAERIIVSGMTAAPADHLGRYSQADIGLDTFPYNGTTTTCEALWMGVPVVTLAGRTHVSRVGASILSHVGLPELIARTEEEYVAQGIALAGDLERLGRLRQELRGRMQSSPLLDRQGFTRGLEAAFRRMWEHRHGVNVPSQ